MITNENTPSTVISSYSGSQAPEKRASIDTSNATPISGVASSDSVSLTASSGRALLMARVFRAVPDANPTVETVDTAGGVTANFLTIADRDQLAKLYDFASKNGIDLAHVDAVSFDLAIYRRSAEKSTNGPVYDPEGHRVTYAFSERETNEANQILSGDKINSTYMDKGFIKEILNPVEMPSHASDFKFLEKAMEVLSPSGDEGKVDASSNPPGFQSNSKWGPGDGVTENKSKDIEFDNATQTTVGSPAALNRRDLIKKLLNEFFSQFNQEHKTYDTLLFKAAGLNAKLPSTPSSQLNTIDPTSGFNQKLLHANGVDLYSLLSKKSAIF